MIHSLSKKKKDICKEYSTYVRNPKVAQRRVDDSVFLIDPDTDRVFYLDALSSGIWNLLEKPININDAVNIVQQAFPDTGARKIARDVSKLMNTMHRRHLVLTGA
jgi:hypothetical protein